MRTFVFDIETDGLDATKIHCLVIQDLKTSKIFKYSDHPGFDGDILTGLTVLNTADILVAHNGIGFDLFQIHKLYPQFDFYNKKVIDTWIMSQVLNYRRGKHGLAAWGERLGYKKGDNTDFNADGWQTFSPKMMDYCIQDVKVNTKVYNILCEELNVIAEKQPLIREGLKVEMEVAKFEAMTRSKGWNFDIDKAAHTLSVIKGRMHVIESIIEPKLKPLVKLIDKQPKFPKYMKSGNYTSATARMLSEFLGMEVKQTDTHKCPPDQSFQRKIEVPATMGNIDKVKDYLYLIGWKPDDWKMKKVGFEWIADSPKLTTTSLEKLGNEGKIIDEYYTLRSRRGVLEGWLENLKDGRLHGRMWIEGTPTFRCRHEVIANLPAVNAIYGKELRELLIPDTGYKVVGADSSSNEFRSLAHYLKDKELTNQILDGDIHEYNASIIGTDRRTAKTWIYAFLYGAGAVKLGQTLTGKRDANAGKRSVEAYGNAIPTLKNLKNKLEEIWKRTSNGGEGYIPAIDGRKLYTPQPYQTLNYLLQSCGAITCKAAVAYQMQKIKEEKLDAYPTLFYHDETAWVAKEEHAERVKEILIESFHEAPKQFGIEFMSGEGVIGDNYAEVH